VVFDANDTASRDEVISFPHLKFDTIVMPNRGYVIGCWNQVYKRRGYDAYLMLCDDVELHPDCLEHAVKALKTNGRDSVIGISQECPGHENYTYKVFGQTLMGNEFVERYKDVFYQVCCPYYTHFYQDEEMWQYATKHAKAVHCKKAILNHYHPAFKKEEIDATHGIVRSNSINTNDRVLFQERQTAGKLWGEAWDK
jgi:hypothetical protein